LQSLDAVEGEVVIAAEGGVTTVADSGAGALTKADVDAVVETTASWLPVALRWLRVADWKTSRRRQRS
jgi:hypothetical protein